MRIILQLNMVSKDYVLLLTPFTCAGSGRVQLLIVDSRYSLITPILGGSESVLVVNVTLEDCV